jgi:pimeloyl-ACP methyl ester carboxylesterase
VIVFEDVAPALGERCTRTSQDPAYQTPPAELVPADANGTTDAHVVRWRLRPELASAAAAREPIWELLTRSADLHYRLLTSRAPAGQTVLTANAYAQLAVTGHRAFSYFRSEGPHDTLLQSHLRERLAAEHVPIDATMLTRSVASALDTAYATAWALRGSPSVRRDLRQPMGWLAVSAPDDHPHRPVNVPSAPYPQFDMRLDVAGREMTCRYMIAASSDPRSTAVYGGRGSRALPPEPTPELPADDRVLLFIHGHGSRLEEAMDLVPWIRRIAAEREERFAVIAVDLPARGYSSMLDHHVVAPAPASFGERIPARSPQQRYPMLEYYEDFIAAFLARLSETLGRPLDDVTVIGGSLGGNLSLRLANPALDTRPGSHARGSALRNIRRHVAWSPASVWASFCEGHDFFKDEALRQTRDKSNTAAETADSRATFLNAVFFDKPGGDFLNGLITGATFGQLNDPAPSQMWWRDDWACKPLAIEGALRDLAEVYNPLYRTWHWRVAYEQLMFSHHDVLPGATGPLYHSVAGPLLLLSGNADDYSYANIYPRTREIALDLPRVPGRGLLLRDTGHSIHNERPGLLATQIIDFVLEGR